MPKLLDSLLGTAGLQRKVVRPTEVLGHAGTAVYGGYLQEYEKNAAVTGREKYRTYSTILANTTIVAAGTRYFLNLVSKATWKIQPADVAGKEAEAERLAELVEDMLYDMDTAWHAIVRRAAMYRFYGFSIQEWTAKRREDGDIGFMDVSPRAQITIERWDTNSNGKVLGVVQRSPLDSSEIYLPRGKLLYLVDDSLNDSPEGLGLFRNVVESSNRLARYEQLEGFGFETDLRGVPIGRLPYSLIDAQVKSGEITAAQAVEVKTALETFIQKHVKSPSLGITLDSAVYMSTDEGTTPSGNKQFDLDLLKGGNTTQAEVAASIERLNYEIARVLGVEHLLLGQSRGTQALSEDKSHNFALIIDSTLSEIEQAVEKDLIDTIFRLNGWDMELKPDCKTEQVQMRNVQQITQALSDMASAGAILDPEDPAIAEVRDLLGLSAPLVGAGAEQVALVTPKDTPLDEPLDDEQE